MSLRIDRLQLEIIINNDQARKQLSALEDEARQINKELRNVREGTQDWIQKSNRLKSIKEQMEGIYQKIGLTGLSLKELAKRQKELNMVFLQMDPRLPQHKQLQEELKAVGNRMNELKGKAVESKLSFGSIADSLNKYQTMIMAGTAALTGMILGIKGLLGAQADLSDSLADIRRTTGMSAMEVEKLNAAFKKLDTRTSTRDLREMAVVAGQLGIEKNTIVNFVSAIDKMNVAMGSEFGNNAETVAKEVGTLRNVLRDLQTANVSEDLLRIGNAVNALGMAGFATAPVVIDFANRIGGIGGALGLTSDEILGLSATLQELNVTTERGGTAIGRILQKMTSHVSTFAEIAGIPVKEFSDLINKDLFGAFTKVLEGTKRGGQSATLLAGIIKDLEIQGAGASEVISKLGNNMGMLQEKVALAGTSLQGTESIMDAFSKKNDNLAGDIAKLGKQFYSLITMPAITSFFRGMVDVMISLVSWGKDLPLIIEKYRVALIALVGVTVAWIATKTRGLQVTILNNLLLKEGILLKLKDQIVMTALIVKEEMLTIWKGKGTIASKLAATAQLLWNAAVAANPIGALIVGITAVVAALAAYEKYNGRALDLEREKGRASALLDSVLSKLSATYDVIKGSIYNVNTLSVQEKIDLQDKVLKTITLAKAQLELAKARQLNIEKNGAELSYWQNLQLGWAKTEKQRQEWIAFYRAKNAKEAGAGSEERINSLGSTINSMEKDYQGLTNIMKAESIGDKILAKTIDALEAKLGKYQIALRNTVAGSADYIRIQEKIKAVNKELGSTNVALDDPKNKQISAYEALNKKIQEFIDLLQVQVMNDPANARVTADKIKRLKEQKKQIDEVVASLTNMVETEETFDQAWERITGQGYVPDREETPGEEFDRVSGGVFGGPDPVDEDPDMAFERITGEKILEPGAKDDVQVWAGKASGFLDYANTLANGLTSIDQLISDSEQRQLMKDAQANDQKKANLKRQLDAKLITQKQYDQGVEKLDNDLAKKQRKLAHDQAVRQKAISLVQAVINTAQGITAALAGTPPASYIMAVLTGILGAVQVGYIASTAVPAAAKGRYKAMQAAMGRYDVIGQSDNKLYRGVPFSYNFDGVPEGSMLTNETGKEIVINPEHTRNLMLNYPLIVEAIRSTAPQKAAGSYPDAVFKKSMPGAQTPVIVQMDPAYLDALKEHTAALNRPSKSYIVWQDIDEANQKMKVISKDMTL
jgi:TP901 family phage tail tape measure protein